MVFVYKGNVESLERQVEEHKDALNQRYREVLGDRYYDKLSKIVNRVLVPESYFNTADEYNDRFGEDLQEETPSKFILFTDSDISLNEKGRVNENSVRMSFGFYINDKSFENSGSAGITDKIIASYVHEFDHFIYGALQNSPLYLVRNALFDEMGGTAIDLSRLTEYIHRVEKENISDKEKKKKLLLASNSYMLGEMWEDSTRILDKLILESIGIDVPLPFRGTRREYASCNLKSPPIALTVPIGGDQFRGLDDKDVVHRVLNWENYLNALGGNEYLDNFYESIKRLQITKMSFPEIERAMDRASEKEKRTERRLKKMRLKNKIKKRKGKRK